MAHASVKKAGTMLRPVEIQSHKFDPETMRFIAVPSFTQKHYEAIAKMIHQKRVEATELAKAENGTQLRHTHEVINTVTLALCKLFKEDNTKFKEMTFIAECNKDLHEVP